MSADRSQSRNTTAESVPTAAQPRPFVVRSSQPPGPLSEDTRVAVGIRGLVERGAMDGPASDSRSWSPASTARVAHRLSVSPRSAEADEAVQDAFVKVFSHIGSYREAWPFEVWFTRILINGCLDRRKARRRRDRWFVGGRNLERRTKRASRQPSTAGRSRAPASRPRAPRANRRGRRSARRPAADGLHAEPLRRLHADGSQRR